MKFIIVAALSLFSLSAFAHQYICINTEAKTSIYARLTFNEDRNLTGAFITYGKQNYRAISLRQQTLAPDEKTATVEDWNLKGPLGFDAAIYLPQVGSLNLGARRVVGQVTADALTSTINGSAALFSEAPMDMTWIKCTYTTATEDLIAPTTPSAP